MHYIIPSFFSSAKSLLYCADAERNAKQAYIPAVGLCHQSRDKFPRIIYCQLCSTTTDTQRHLTVQEGTEGKAPAYSKYVWGGVEKQNGNPGV